MAKQLGAEAYLECSAFTSEKSIHSVFRTAAVACMNKPQPANKPSPVRRLSKRLLHLPSKTELLSSTFSKEKSKSCSIMWNTAGIRVEKRKEGQVNYTVAGSAGVQGVQGRESNKVDFYSVPLSFAVQTPSTTSKRSLYSLYSTLTLNFWSWLDTSTQCRDRVKKLWCLKYFWSIK